MVYVLVDEINCDISLLSNSPLLLQFFDLCIDFLDLVLDIDSIINTFLDHFLEFSSKVPYISKISFHLETLLSHLCLLAKQGRKVEHTTLDREYIDENGLAVPLILLIFEFLRLCSNSCVYHHGRSQYHDLLINVLLEIIVIIYSGMDVDTGFYVAFISLNKVQGELEGADMILGLNLN